jgi:hypothetical protein
MCTCTYSSICRWMMPTTLHHDYFCKTLRRSSHTHTQTHTHTLSLSLSLSHAHTRTHNTHAINTNSCSSSNPCRHAHAHARHAHAHARHAHAPAHARQAHAHAHARHAHARTVASLTCREHILENTFYCYTHSSVNNLPLAPALHAAPPPPYPSRSADSEASGRRGIQSPRES